MQITHNLLHPFFIVNTKYGYEVWKIVTAHITKTGVRVPERSVFDTYHPFFGQALKQICENVVSNQTDRDTLDSFIKRYEDLAKSILAINFEISFEVK